MKVVKKATRNQIEGATKQAAQASQKIKETFKFKVTEFEGYLSGDYECFCLSFFPVYSSPLVLN